MYRVFHDLPRAGPLADPFMKRAILISRARARNQNFFDAE
jgi:hypothetical protein